MSSALSQPCPDHRSSAMRNVIVIARRELAAYFISPLAYVFFVIFLALAGALGFYVGGFFQRGQADPAAFFLFLMSGLDLVLDAFRGWAPAYVVDLVGSFSFLTHFAAIAKGVIGLPTAIFLISLMLLCLFVN